jgi:hypothetical protein
MDVLGGLKRMRIVEGIVEMVNDTGHAINLTFDAKILKPAEEVKLIQATI